MTWRRTGPGYQQSWYWPRIDLNILGGVSIYWCRLTSIEIAMSKIRRSRDRLIFNMGILIHGKDGLYIETGPWFQHNLYKSLWCRFRAFIRFILIILFTYIHNTKCLFSYALLLFNCDKYEFCFNWHLIKPVHTTCSYLVVGPPISVWNVQMGMFYLSKNHHLEIPWPLY